MADGVAVTPGSGATIATDDDGTMQHQYVKVEWGPDNTQTKVGTGANALPIQDGGNSITVDGTVAVSGTVAVTDNSGSLTVDGTVDVGTVTTVTGITNVVHVDDNAGSLTVDGTVGVSGTVTVDSELTTADLDTGAGTDTRAVVGLVGSKSGGGALIPGDATAGLKVDLGADNDVTVTSGTITTITNVVHVDDNSSTISVDDGAGSLTVDGTVAATQSGTWTVQPGNTANTTAWKVDASSVAVPVTDNSGSLTVDAPVATPVFVRLSDGAAAITALPVTDNAGSLTVDNGGTFATQAAQSGTWTVQPGNTQNTTAWLTSQTPATSGGLTTYHLVSAATTNATNIKASAGQVYGWYIYNSNAAARKVAFHNSASAPTAGASVFFAIVIPPSSAANVEFTSGIAFSSGIGITTVTDLTDAGATAVGASDLIINIFYK